MTGRESVGNVRLSRRTRFRRGPVFCVTGASTKIYSTWTAERPNIYRVPNPMIERGSGPIIRGAARSASLVLLAAAVPYLAGCAERRSAAPQSPPARPQLVAIAPVVNLSNSRDWDVVRATDILAAEVAAREELAVVPVNASLGAMHRLGRPVIETWEDAEELANEVNADLVLVFALTEYDPYDPPRVGITAQMYDIRARRSGNARVNADGLKRAGVEWSPAAESEAETGSVTRFQGVYDAAHETTLADVRVYAAQRHGHRSPLEWRRHIESQEAFLRYAIWAAIRSMERERQYYRSGGAAQEAAEPPRSNHEARS